jgi:hypothetical protein
MESEYHNGPEALERFEKGMTKLFQAPKPGVKRTTKQPTKTRKASTAECDSKK